MSIPRKLAILTRWALHLKFSQQRSAMLGSREPGVARGGHLALRATTHQPRHRDALYTGTRARTSSLRTRRDAIRDASFTFCDGRVTLAVTLCVTLRLYA
jgi:hypothetical protein